MSDPAYKLYTVEEYLALEETSEAKHEYYAGDIFAMSGASPRHAFILQNISQLIGPALPKSCRSATAGLRITREEAGFFFYPDYVVICGGVQVAKSDPNSVTNPTVIVEVLSPSTAQFDKTFKLIQYQQIPSLKQYMLVHQDRKLVETYTRNGDTWERAAFSGDHQAIPVPVGEISILVAEIYFGIDFQASH